MPKISRGVPWSQYLELPGLRFSQLKLIGRSPAHFQYALSDTDPKDTDAMRVGRALHAAILEPKTFGKRFAVYDGRRAGKVWEAFQAQHADKEHLTLAQGLTVSNLSLATRKDPTVSKLLTAGHPEVTIQFEIEGRECKARIDFLGKAVLDLKTTKDASPDSFGRQAYTFGYYAQAAWYVDAVQAATGKALPFYFVAIESAAPYPVQAYQVDSELLQFGRETYQDYLSKLAECERSDRWGGYLNGISKLQMPRWASLVEDEGDVEQWGISFNSSTKEN